MRILVTGATGLIGRNLIYRLLIHGHEVLALARSPQRLTELPEQNIYSWSDDKTPPPEALSDCDAVIHLAGEGIVDKRWTNERKKRLRDSRIFGTTNLISAIANLPEPKRPKVLISGSAIGIYGSSTETKTEDSKPGKGFLADLCVEWENEALKANTLGVRTVLLRTGLVLSNQGGLLKKSAPVVLGSGNQWMSWVHIEDMISFIEFGLRNPKLSGAYNIVAPNPVTNREFSKLLSRSMGLPVLGKAPTSLLKLVLGEASEAVLADQKVIPKKTISTGFRFKYENLESALSDLIGRKSILDNAFRARQFIPLAKDKVFPFFAKAENLETLTPPWLNFHIYKKSTPEIQKGSLIDYKLKIHGVTVKWKTLISEWVPGFKFVDDQLKGPYKKWHHVHTFDSVNGGTLISDEVTFQPPGHIFGKLLLPIIRRDVNEIFKFRQEKIRELERKGEIG